MDTFRSSLIDSSPQAITKRHDGGGGGYWAVYKPQTVPVAWRFYGDMGSQAHSEKDVLSVLGIPLLSTDKESYSSYQDQGYDVVYVTQ